MTTTAKGKQTFKLTTEVKDVKYTGGKSYDSPLLLWRKVVLFLFPRYP
jgi:hypothetical protein